MSLYISFYIRVGKDQVYIKCLNNDQWGVFSSKLGVDQEGLIVKVDQISGNLKYSGSLTNGIPVKTINPLDHPRLVISGFEEFEMFLRHLIRRFKTKWYSTMKTVFFHLDYIPEGGLTDVEERAFRDSIEHTAAKELYFLRSGNEISEDQVKTLFDFVEKQHFLRRKKLPQDLKGLLLKTYDGIPRSFHKKGFKSY